MGVAVHGGTAGVHLDDPWRGWLNLFNPFGQSVVDAEQWDLFYLRLRLKTLRQFSTFQWCLPYGFMTARCGVC